MKTALLRRNPVELPQVSGALSPVYDSNKVRVQALDYTITPTQQVELERFRTNWLTNKSRYEGVARLTGIPAKLIAAIHYRESGMRWDTYLHQGDPLGKPAVHWPTNIPVFDVWEDAAIHALNTQARNRDALGMNVDTTDEATWATFAEAYNGLGYFRRGSPSPYVWSGTNQYGSGMYVADGVYDANRTDPRVGIMALVSSIGGTSEDKGSSATWLYPVLVGGSVLLVGLGLTYIVIKKRRKKLIA